AEVHLFARIGVPHRADLRAIVRRAARDQRHRAREAQLERRICAAGEPEAAVGFVDLDGEIPILGRAEVARVALDRGQLAVAVIAAGMGGQVEEHAFPERREYPTAEAEIEIALADVLRPFLAE